MSDELYNKRADLIRSLAKIEVEIAKEHELYKSGECDLDTLTEMNQASLVEDYEEAINEIVKSQRAEGEVGLVITGLEITPAKLEMAIEENPIVTIESFVYYREQRMAVLSLHDGYACTPELAAIFSKYLNEY